MDCRSEKMKLIVVFRLDLVKNIVKRKHLVKGALENEDAAKDLIESQGGCRCTDICDGRSTRTQIHQIGTS